MQICGQIDELKSMFRDFDAVQRKKTNSKMVISNLAEMLQTAFKFDSGSIIESVERNIQAARQ